MDTKREIDDLLAGVKNGFEVLQETKQNNKAEVESYLWKHPTASAAEMAKHFGLAQRTITRYLAELRLESPALRDLIDARKKLQKTDSDARFSRFVSYLKDNPRASHNEICRGTGISLKTLKKYLLRHWKE